MRSMAAFVANDRQLVLFRLIRKLPNRFARLMLRERPEAFVFVIFDIGGTVSRSGLLFSDRADPYVP